jgi:hypothetical protein
MEKRTWRNEFGEDYAIPQRVLDLVSEGKLVDASWHNDASPSFATSIEPQSVTLWVEHPDPAQREIGGPRYCVVEYDENHEMVGEARIVTDDLEEAIAKMELA